MIKYKQARKVAVVSLDCLFLIDEDERLHWNREFIKKINEGNYDRLVFLCKANLKQKIERHFVKQNFPSIGDENFLYKENVSPSDKAFFKQMLSMEKRSLQEDEVLVVDFHDVNENNFNQMIAVNDNFKKTIVNPVVVTPEKKFDDYQQGIV